MPSQTTGGECLGKLELDGLISLETGTPRTTRRFQSAMARAAARLYGLAVEDDDLRFPLALAFMDLYGDALPDDQIAGLVDAMLPIEAAELDPRRHLDAKREASLP